MPTVMVPRDFIEAVAAEMTQGIETAVQCWMKKVDSALTDPQLTSLGRLRAVQEIVDEFKRLSGKTELECRRPQPLTDAV